MNLLRQVRNAIAISVANCFPRLGIFNRLRWRILKLGGGGISKSQIWAPIDVRPFGCLKNLKVGEGTFVNTGFRCGVPHGVEVIIGKNCAVGPRVSIETVNHNLLWSETEKWGVKAASVKIGDRVWIGSGAIILPGVIIGNDSVIAAGSVVTKSFPEKSIVGGVPAKLIRENTSERQLNV
jgi:maltose O-acetyltransferase